jgi:hypothetical protein
MSIDITGNIIFEAGGNNIGRPEQGDSSRKALAEAADSTLRTEYAGVIQLALEFEDADAAAVREASLALEAGLLDTAENASSAAERILESGI